MFCNPEPVGEPEGPPPAPATGRRISVSRLGTTEGDGFGLMLAVPF